MEKTEEIKQERIKIHINELESFVRSCDNKVLKHAYLLGEEKVSFKDAGRIARLIAEFELDCKCASKPI